MSQVQSFRNQFLISLPVLRGDYFQDSISLLIDHNDEGAFGLIINQPLQIKISEILPELEGLFECPVLLGGPVQRDRLFFLHPHGEQFEGTVEISDEISLTTTQDFIEAIKTGKAPGKTMALLGYAGWGAEQLEHELSENVWLLSPTCGRIVFDEPFKNRPAEAAKLLGVDLNLILPLAGHD
jgi:putative transcriptional regulator